MNERPIWHSWFAWYPVRLKLRVDERPNEIRWSYTEHYVWWERIERRETRGYLGSWEYRFISP